MPLFLDSGNIRDIVKFMKMGIIRGVTTNPTIMLKDGVTGGMKGVKKRTLEIAGLIHPYPLSVEVTSNEAEQMLAQAQELSALADNIIIKVPIHGPNGELFNLDIVHELAQHHRIHTNVTAMMSAQQGLLAALAGAAYVSLFGGRINNMGYNTCEEIRKLRRVLDDHQLRARIITGSTREVLTVSEWLTAGTHFVTVTPGLLEGMIVHPYSKETVQMFLKDGAAVEKAAMDTIAPDTPENE